LIDGRIFDFNDDYTKGTVQYAPVATGPIQSAPAYVRSVTLEPESPVGIERVDYKVEFSRPMDAEFTPDLSFQSILIDTWKVFNTGNSGLPNNTVNAIAVDEDGSLWFGTNAGVAHFDGGIWTVYNTSNSGLPHDTIMAIITNLDGSHWFGTDGGGVAHFDGSTWTVYSTANSMLPSDTVLAIVTDPDGSHWFGTNGGGAVHFDGSTWTVYNASNSGLPHDWINALIADLDGSHWFGTYGGGAAHFDGSTWIVYNASNSGLPMNTVMAIVTDPDGSHWFGTSMMGAAHFDGSTWTVYNASNSGLPIGTVLAIVTDPDGSHWFGTISGAVHFDGSTWTVYNASNSGLPNGVVNAIVTDPGGSHWFGTEGGVGVLLYSPQRMIQDNPLWLDAPYFQASYDITSLIPRDTYALTVSGAIGSDGIEIAPNSAFTFTVDYAGGVGDTTPPPQPMITACAGGTPDNLSASWEAHDPDSGITLNSYAIGSSPGGTDVVNWTNTAEASFTRSGLSLIAGQVYYISVRARNAGGLWSEAATAGVQAGSGMCTASTYRLHLPLIQRVASGGVLFQP
jgi:sugar lactone lactonase YvrE